MIITVTIMSGVEDGQVLELETTTHGQHQNGSWVLTIGRREESDICLRSDSFVSRDHASLRFSNECWYLTDNDSKNGSFMETAGEDMPIKGTVTLTPEQLFRVGHTWLQLQTNE